MGLINILEEKSRSLNKIPNIDSIPDRSNPCVYLQLFFKNKFIGSYTPKGIEIKKPFFTITHNPIYRKIKEIVLD